MYLLYCFWFAFIIHVLFFMHVGVDFVGEDNVDFGVGVCDGGAEVAITPMVQDSISTGVSGASIVSRGPPNILIGVTSSNYNVHVAFTYRQKMVPQVPTTSFLHLEKNVVQVPKFGVDGFGFEMDSKGAFWNEVFEKELPKYKDRLTVIFPCHPLETISVNIISGHVFSHLHNCPISITYVVDPKSLLNLGVPSGGHKLGLSFILDSSYFLQTS
jgi:hypothetical protein